MKNCLTLVITFVLLVFIGSLFADSDYDNAFEYFNKQEYDEAFKYANKIPQDDKDFIQAQKLLVLINKKIDSLNLIEQDKFVKQTIKITIDDIFVHFAQNKETAIKKFTDNKVAVSGIITKKLLDGQNSREIIHIGSSLFSQKNIRLNLSDNQFKNARRGDSVYITGELSGSIRQGFAINNLENIKIVQHNTLATYKNMKAVSAEKIYLDYSNNELAADNKYQNTIFPIYGFVKSIEKESNKVVTEFEEDGYVVTLYIDERVQFETSNYKINYILCYFSSSEKESIEKLKSETVVKIVGICNGMSKYYSGLMFTNCLIL